MRLEYRGTTEIAQFSSVYGRMCQRFTYLRLYLAFGGREKVSFNAHDLIDMFNTNVSAISECRQEGRSAFKSFVRRKISLKYLQIAFLLRARREGRVNVPRDCQMITTVARYLGE